MYEDELAFAHRVADRADEMAVALFRTRRLQVDRKADRTLVTEADTAIERMVREELASVFPDDHVLGEEEGGDVVPGGRQWVLDPIDATANFAKGVPIWGTLLGLLVDGETVVGVASAPALSERYAAAVGGGATMNGEPIHVSAVDTIGAAHLSFHEPEVLLGGPLREATERLIAECWRPRAFGDFWGHMLVARGAVDAVIEPSLNLWDVAALRVIVSEAGGRITAFDGSPASHRTSALTTNGLLHDELLARLTG
ncbi:MAG TPA: inositol monophosphatase family protein [Actinomycetota bacterium]|nr:inositol monophosphatase family protein [Actinomycetota bacterium]